MEEGLAQDLTPNGPGDKAGRLPTGRRGDSGKRRIRCRLYVPEGGRKGGFQGEATILKARAAVRTKIRLALFANLSSCYRGSPICTGFVVALILVRAAYGVLFARQSLGGGI